jgi:hypothetical protein
MAWTQTLPVHLPAGDLKLTTLSVVRLQGAKVAATEVNSAPDVWTPAWLFTPDEQRALSSAVLVLDDRGRNAHAHEDDLYHQLARSGRILCAADIRGLGDTRPEVGRGNPNYTIPHDSGEDFAWASLILGDPLLAQWITDILALVKALKNETALRNAPLSIAARGRLTVPALFAFAASQEVNSLYLAGGLVSFQNLLETEIYEEPLANFAWNLFRLTDLPALASQSAPRRIHLAGAVNGSNSLVAIDELRRIYASQNIEFSSEPAWNEKALSL